MYGWTDRQSMPEVSSICIELEKVQGDIRDEFQQVRLYANFTYYKMDVQGQGHPISLFSWPFHIY